MSVITE